MNFDAASAESASKQGRCIDENRARSLFPYRNIGEGVRRIIELAPAEVDRKWLARFLSAAQIGRAPCSEDFAEYVELAANAFGVDCQWAAVASMSRAPVSVLLLQEGQEIELQRKQSYIKRAMSRLLCVFR